MRNIKEIVTELTAYKDELEWFEFKTNLDDTNAIGEYVSALSNAAALKGQHFGYLVWGIHDKTHECVGTRFDYHRSVDNEPLQHYIARNLSPDLNLEFDEEIVDGNRIVVLAIPAASKVPTAFKGVRYIRIGSSKVNLMKYPDREAALFRVLNFGYPSIVNTEAEYQDLTFEQLFIYYSLKGITLKQNTFKKNLELLTDSGKYNLLAQLLSDNPHIPIRFSLFNGKTKASTMYAVREFGNMCILMALDRVLDYGEILNVPQADERNRHMERKEVMLFNIDAYREAIINAFVHNSWVSGNEPMFTVYSDRIEILSRGTLPPDQTIEGFFAGESIPVNRKLSEIFLQLHISEKSGRGVPKIVEVYGKDAVEFRENTIVVTIPFEQMPAAREDATGGIESTDTPVSTLDNTPVSTLDNTPDIFVGSIEDKILNYCIMPRGILEITNYLGYREKKSTRKYLRPLLDQGRIAMTIPEKPNSKNQKYITIR